MTTPDGYDVISGPAAAEAAGISYRQLDHWARKGWVVPSIQKAAGKTSRRVYSAEDVMRLRILKQFAQAAWPLQEVAEELADADLGGRFLIKTPEGLISASDELDLASLACRPEMISVFDLAAPSARDSEASAELRDERRSA